MKEWKEVAIEFMKLMRLFFFFLLKDFIFGGKRLCIKCDRKLTLDKNFIFISLTSKYCPNEISVFS